MENTSTPAPPHVLCFGVFELDLEANELRRKGVRLKLQDQPLHLLKVLLDEPGTLVSREQLRHRLWKPDTFVEFDHSLNTAMVRLREVLGDSSDNPRFIETVPRKGYRFIAPVHAPIHAFAPAFAPAAATPTAILPETPPAREAGALVPAARPGRDEPTLWMDAPSRADTPPPALRALYARCLPHSFTARWAALPLLVLLLSVTSGILVKKGHRRPASAPHTLSIVVLPLEDLSPDRSQAYFADGMTNGIIASLSRVSAPLFISRATAMAYRERTGSLEKTGSLERIASGLNADDVVQGTVLHTGDRVRITVELVQASTGRPLWADTFEGPLSDVLGLQNRVAAALVGRIRLTLSPQDRQQLASTPPLNSGTFDDYLKGRYFWGQRSQNSLDRAIGYFTSATEKDPGYALAYAGLADSYDLLGTAIVGTVSANEVAPRAEAAATRAVELDPTQTETQTALATVRFNYNWDWIAAESGFRRAIALNPGYPTAHQRYSLYLMAMGRTSESLDEINRARSLDPLSLSLNVSLGWRLYMARQYDEAIVQLRNTIEMDPSYLLAHIVLAQCYEQKGQFAQAIAELQKADALSPGSPPVTAALGHAYAMAGNRPRALFYLDRLKATAATQYVSPYFIALLYAGLDDHRQAIDWLDKAYNDRSNNIIFINVDPQLDSLRQDPAFQLVASRIRRGPPRAEG